MDKLTVIDLTGSIPIGPSPTSFNFGANLKPSTKEPSPKPSEAEADLNERLRALSYSDEQIEEIHETT